MLSKECFLVIASLFAFSSVKAETPSFVEKLPELSGLLFSEIGEMKLIVEHREILFNVSLENIRKTINYLKKDIEKIEADTREQINADFKVAIEAVKQTILLREMELDDYSFGSSELRSKRSIHRIRKRAFFDDVWNIFGGGIDERSFKNFQEKINHIVDIVNNQTISFDKTRKDQNRRILRIVEQSVLNDFRAKAYLIDTKLDAIHFIQTTKRLKRTIVNAADLEKALADFSRTLSNDREIPYKRKSEYFYNLEVTHDIQNDTLLLKIEVPIVQKIKRKLYLIEEFPTIHKKVLHLTNVKWKYLAISDETDDALTLTDLNKCTAPIDSVYFCETESPIIKVSGTNDCATNSFVNKETDVKNCDIKPFRADHSLFIKLVDGKFFYYAHKNEDIIMKCNEMSRSTQLEKGTTGILKLDAGCMLVTDKYILMSTSKYEEEAVHKSIFIGYDEAKLLHDTKDSIVPLDSKHYVESLKDFREMPNKKPIGKMQNNDLKIVIFITVSIFASTFLIITLYLVAKGVEKRREFEGVVLRNMNT